MENQISSFPLTALLVGAHYEYHYHVMYKMASLNPEQLDVEELCGQYTQEIYKLQQLVNRIIRSSYTQKIREADDLRDNLLRQLLAQVKLAAKNPIAEIYEAGRVLLPVILPYNGVMGNEYNKATAEIRGLLRDIGTMEMQPYVSRLNLTLIVNNLKSANDKFSQLIEQRVEENMQRQVDQGMDTKDQQRIVNDLYKQMILHLNAKMIIDPNERVEEFVAWNNALNREYRNVISHMRSGGSGNEKRNEKPDDPEIIPGDNVS